MDKKDDVTAVESPEDKERDLRFMQENCTQFTVDMGGFEEKRYRCPKGHEVVKKWHPLFSIGGADNMLVNVKGWFGKEEDMFVCRECVADFLSDKLMEEVK
jgi:hypothetical protein